MIWFPAYRPIVLYSSYFVDNAIIKAGFEGRCGYFGYLEASSRLFGVPNGGVMLGLSSSWYGSGEC